MKTDKAVGFHEKVQMTLRKINKGKTRNFANELDRLAYLLREMQRTQGTKNFVLF